LTVRKEKWVSKGTVGSLVILDVLDPREREVDPVQLG
jgi:hypothetical protein